MKNPFLTVSHAIDSSFQKCFFKLGFTVATRPKLTILISLLVAFAAISGVTKYATESRADKLWSPTESDPVKYAALVSKQFPPMTRSNTIYVTAKNPGQSVLSLDVLSEVRTIEEGLMAITAKAATNTVPMKEWTWTELKTMRGMTSILDTWENRQGVFNKTLFEADKNNLPAAISAKASDATVEYVLGGVQKVNGVIASAELLRVVFDLANNEYNSAGTLVDPPAEKWEEEAMKYLQTTQFSYVNVIPNTKWGYSEESGNAIRGDLGLVGGSIMLIVVYLLTQLGKCNCIQSRVALALGGLCCVGLALGVSYGLGSVFSPYTPVHSVLPFLIMGIGVDDIFVVVNEFDLTAPKEGEKKKTVPQRMSQALKHAGTSITVTTLTDFLAFMISSATLLPALSSFCIWAAFAVLGCYFFTCTLFVAMLTYDAQRQEAKRPDCCCCLKPRTPNPNPGRCARGGFVSSCINNRFKPMLNSMIFRIAMILVFLGVAGGAIPQLLEIKQNFRREWFLPSDSYLQDYVALTDKHFSSIGAPVSMYVADIDPHGNHQMFKDMRVALDSNSFVSSSLNLTDWHHEFDTYMTYQKQKPLGTLDKATYHKELKGWLNTQGQRYSGDVVYKDGENVLAMTRISAFLKGFSTATAELNAMKSLVADGSKVATAYGYDKWQLFAFGFTFPSWYQYDIIPTEAITNIGFTLLAVFIIVVIFIASVPMAFLVTGVVGLVLVDILGYMTLWDVDLNGVSVVNLVLSVGLSVDYSAHIGHAFMHKQGTRVERAGQAVADMGVSVINGAVSTFLAVCLLGLSKSYVFVVFFKMFFLTCVFGALHGLVFFPVLLSFIGPSAFPDTHAELKEVDVDVELEKGTSAKPGEPAAEKRSKSHSTKVEVEAEQTGLITNGNATVSAEKNEKVDDNASTQDVALWN